MFVQNPNLSQFCFLQLLKKDFQSCIGFNFQVQEVPFLARQVDQKCAKKGQNWPKKKTRYEIIENV